MKLVKFIRFYSRRKPLIQKQKEIYQKHIRKVMEDFEEVWGDDLEWLDLLDEVSSKNTNANKNPQSI